MPDNPTLEAQNSAPNSSQPAGEVENKAVEGVPAAQDDAQKVDAKDESQKEEPKELTEADKIRQATQKRIDRMTAASKAQAERMRQLEAKIEEFRAKAPKDDAPKQSDFEKYEDWEQANIEYKAKQLAETRIAEAREAELKAATERQQAEVRRQFETSEVKFRESTPDYDRVAKEAVDTMQTLAQLGTDIKPLRDMVMQFDNPPEMIYQLGKDPSVIEDLVHMSPLKAMRELVKLEDALKSAVKAANEPPEPIKPVGGKGGAKPLHQRTGKDILAWVKS